MRILVLLSLGLLSFAFFCYANASHVIEPEPETEAEYPTDYELEEEIEESPLIIMIKKINPNQNLNIITSKYVIELQFESLGRMPQAY
uniref:Uncharacterized protein n=1 Tax=Glossina brevipalpis TaxID=37001 RepID=A0A1A9WNM5_9MUSC